MNTPGDGIGLDTKVHVAWYRGDGERLRATPEDPEPLGQTAPANGGCGSLSEARPESRHRGAAGRLFITDPTVESTVAKRYWTYVHHPYQLPVGRISDAGD
jgi:hypothetical protein